MAEPRLTEEIRARIRTELKQLLAGAELPNAEIERLIITELNRYEEIKQDLKLDEEFQRHYHVNLGKHVSFSEITNDHAGIDIRTIITTLYVNIIAMAKTSSNTTSASEKRERA